MADGIGLLRATVARHVAQKVGLRPEQPTASVANQKTIRNQSDVYVMPVDGQEWFPLQVLDTNSDDFGLFYFYPGYDVPGDPTKVIR